MVQGFELARSFIETAELPPRPQAPVGQGEGDEKPFSTVKDQASVVGSDIVAFVAGTEDTVREAISNSSLLAQLVATKKVGEDADIYEWYKAYFSVLRNIGWLVQDEGFAEYAEEGDGFEVHERILDVAAVLLAPAPAALAVVKTTLKALKGLSENSPWITLFSRESVKAESARFQVTVVEPGVGQGLLVSMIAFGIKASTTITQVLFFKVKKNRATLRSNSARLSLNAEALADLAPLIKQKVRAYQRHYVKTLPGL